MSAASAWLRCLAASMLVALAVPAGADAKLPKPDTTKIVPNKSIAGVKLDMTKAQVIAEWGTTSCPNDLCQWNGPGPVGRKETAIVSIYNGRAIQITITAASSGDDLKFKPGALSKWKTSKGISLGSEKNKVAKAYPDAKSNEGEAVQGFDLFAGKRPDLRYTRFATPGIGATPTKLRYISLAWDVCHFDPSVC